jgi:acyl-[acyl-carrier-protein]-phospholipid O-acyltransferase/long-chain-fatty-acid--[acyl-carrier-protein] ligase
MNQDVTEDKKSFAWLNVTQFFGALNDNVFQMLVIFFLVHVSGVGTSGQASIMATATIVFVIPFLLFSHAAGVIADRFSKSRVIVFTKCLEVVVMVGGLIAILYAGTGSSVLLYAMIMLMCTQSTIFGPSKYGIIPELVRKERLSKANSYLTGLTYLAIIGGTFIPSLFVDRIFPGNHGALAMMCVVLAVIGLIASMQIKATAPAASKRRFTLLFPVDMFKTMRRIKSDRFLFLTVIAAAYFLFLGAFIKLNMLIYGQQMLGLNLVQSGYLFTVAALGIGVGALMAGWLSGRNIEFGIVPLGAMGLAASCILLSVLPGNIPTALVLLFFVGMSTGLFIVPLNSFIQYRVPKGQLGEILACQNFLGFVGVILAAATLKGLTALFQLNETLAAQSASSSFMVIGILTIVLAVSVMYVLPDFFVRFVMLIVTRCIYRIKVRGIENVPADGPALLVPNHVTWVDSLLICATQQRRIRFVMAREVMEKSMWKPLFKLMRVIPISPSDPPRMIVESLKTARTALQDGALVCIFAEGTLTRNGNMNGFKAGMEKIVKGTGAPIVPVHIGGAWGSIFSYYHGKLMSSLPKQIPYPVSISFGKPLPETASGEEVRHMVLELSADSYELKKTKKRSLPRQFVRAARRFWFKPAISDTTGKRLNFGKTLIASLALSKQVEKLTEGQDKVGVVLPASVGGALTNTAIAFLGKVSVNLNFTASKSSIESALTQCEISTVISSKAFLEKLEGFEAPKGTVFIEDIMLAITGGDRFKALLKALFVPAGMLCRGCRESGPDDLATIIFSSGSTGEPKGVMLTHHNIISNIEQICDLYHFNPQEGVCGILPFFHSFGFTVTLWCPLITGARVAYHPNPVDGEKIAEVIRENKLTMLFTTPTFLMVYIRRAKKEDFASLRLIITGAEKLKQRIADSFEKRFDIRPMEGYGTTELAPVAAVSLPDVEIDGGRHIGDKEGSIGHPVPSVAMKIVDPDTGELVPSGEQGMLMVKGPNVMAGYLNNPEKTAEVLRDGWYETGDIAKVDNDGFIFILDRMSRYSKIGGEMVPHLAVEEKLMQALKTVNQTVFVTSIDDEKKGEQLAVLHTDEAGDPDNLRKIISESDLPNLWRPRQDKYFKIDELPTLGSGKLDLKQLKGMARALAGQG